MLNEAGNAAGYSERFNGGSNDRGRSAWLYDGTSTINIGLTGPEFTRSDGYKYSNVGSPLNEAGQIVGNSDRFNGGNNFGRTAWLYDGATTIDIGLTGSEYARSDGYRSSLADEINQAGQAIGHSARYSGSTNLGQTAWFYDGVTTIPIGLTGSEHTRSDGLRWSEVLSLYDSGHATGYSRRYNGSSNSGSTPWVYDGVATIPMELSDGEHTGSSGRRQSSIEHFNAGNVLGSSDRFFGSSNSYGNTLWLYDGLTTAKIGLTGQEHTSNTGSRYLSAYSMNAAGQALGYSTRYNGGSLSADLGRSVWFYDGASTIPIGLTGSAHTRSDGYKYSQGLQMNEAGQVLGCSWRGGSFEMGEDAWFYDPTLGQTITLNLSTRSDGYASSSAAYLGEDGLVLGSYTLFDALDNDLGRRAFYFTIADGLRDLGSLVDGDLESSGWHFLASVFRANGLGQILGNGKLASQSSGQMAYLLSSAAANPPADFNADGSVDAADYVVWRKNNGPQAEYSTWYTTFGETIAGGSSSINSRHATVPEPPAMLWFIAASVAAVLNRRRFIARTSTRFSGSCEVPSFA
jgi:hypothetical protein